MIHKAQSVAQILPRKKYIRLVQHEEAIRKLTRSSAIADRPTDTLFQLKSCQLLESCTKSYIFKGLQ